MSFRVSGMRRVAAILKARGIEVPPGGDGVKLVAAGKANHAGVARSGFTAAPGSRRSMALSAWPGWRGRSTGWRAARRGGA